MQNEFAVDSHCHLDLLEKDGYNIDVVVADAIKSGVKIMQTICTNFDDLDKLIAYSNKYDEVYNSIGLHPCNVNKENILKAEDMLKLCNKSPKIIGIGETGLDFYHQNDNHLLQKQSFLSHIELSQNTELPLIIHSRNADKMMIDILKSEQKNCKFPALLHCFSSSAELANIAIDLDIKISVAGIVTFKNAKELQDIIKNVPLEYLMIETDSPYLAPVPHRGQVNQPAFVIEVAKMIAVIKNLDLATILSQTTSNFLSIFKKVVL